MKGFITFSGLVFLLDSIRIVGIGKNAKKVHTFKPSEMTYIFKGAEFKNPTIETDNIEIKYLTKQYGCIEIIK